MWCGMARHLGPFECWHRHWLDHKHDNVRELELMFWNYQNMTQQESGFWISQVMGKTRLLATYLHMNTFPVLWQQSWAIDSNAISISNFDNSRSSLSKFFRQIIMVDIFNIFTHFFTHCKMRKIIKFSKIFWTAICKFK